MENNSQQHNTQGENSTNTETVFPEVAQQQNIVSSPKNGSKKILILSICTVVLVGGFMGWVLLQNKPAQQSTVQPTEQVQNESDANDDIRKKHAIRFAVNLYNVYLIQEQTVSIDQNGFNSFSRLGTQDISTDPLTKSNYIFKADQTTMVPGDVTFKLGASCDNKIKGSKGTGLIVAGSSRSVAVAIKLESGLFACESSL